MPFRPILLSAHNPGPMTGRGNNTFLLAGSGGRSALIDAGVGDPLHLADIDRQLAATRTRVDRVFVTHGHRDHASGAPVLAAAHKEAAFFKYPWPDDGARYPIPWTPLADGDIVTAGDTQLAVLHTPGHAPDHVAFWHEPSRTAFSGDLVMAAGSVMINWNRGGNLAEYLASLERLAALAPLALLPAHGPRVDDPPRLLAACLEHRRMRERQVMEALGAGRDSVQAIAESIYDGLDPELMTAAHETVRAHLEKLKAEGRARDEAGRWTL